MDPDPPSKSDGHPNNLSIASRLLAALKTLSPVEERARLLRPRALLDATFGSALDLAPDALRDFYLQAGEAVLKFRCGGGGSTSALAGEITTPLLRAQTIPVDQNTGTPVPDQRGGETMRLDHAFLACRNSLPDRGLVWLLYQYAGREYDEIASLLGLPLEGVFDAAILASARIEDGR